jgi:hypothetical protein
VAQEYGAGKIGKELKGQQGTTQPGYQLNATAL